MQAQIYTDGSCHTQLCIGSWVAIIIIESEKIILSGRVDQTTHNRMELTAVIRGIEYVKLNYGALAAIQIISDSQYVIGLTRREAKLTAKNFITKKGNEIRNADLVHQLLGFAKAHQIEFVKIKAHQKLNEESEYNIEADQLSRQIVRHAVKEIG